MEIDDRLRRAAGLIKSSLATEPISPVPAPHGHGWGILGSSAFAVLAVGFIACMGGGRIEPSAVLTPSTVDSATVTTASMMPLPMLSEPTDTILYLTTDDQLTVIDVDSAEVTVHEVPELAPGDPPYRLISRGDQLVFYGQTETEPAVFAIEPSQSLTPVLIDEAWFFVPSAEEDRVWLAILDTESHATVRGLESLREVAVNGTVTVEDVPAPGGRWPVGEVTEGLLFQEGDIEVWDPQTQTLVETLVGPFPVATWNNRIATCGGSCDDLTLYDLDSGSHSLVDAPEAHANFDGYGGAFSPDGRYIAVPIELTDSDTPIAVALIDFESGTATVIPGSRQEQWGYPQVVWSPSGEWVFFSNGASSNETGEMVAYRPGDTTAHRVPVVLDGQYYGIAAGDRPTS